MKTLKLSIIASLIAVSGYAAEPITDSQVEAAASLEFINTATAKQLEEVKGVGPVISARIISARPYRDTQEIYLVKGIGEIIGERILNHGAKNLWKAPLSR